MIALGLTIGLNRAQQIGGTVPPLEAPQYTDATAWPDGDVVLWPDGDILGWSE
jgi:hypothetical protein